MKMVVFVDSIIRKRVKLTGTVTESATERDTGYHEKIGANMLDFLRELKNDADETEAKSIALVTLALGFISLFMCIVNISTRTLDMSLITGGLCIICILNYLVYKIRNSFTVLSIGTLLAIAAMMIHFVITGGKDGFSIVWLLLIPPVGIFFYKLLYGGIFSILMGLFLMIYFWSPLHYYGYAYSDTYILRFPMVYFFDTVICIYINYKLWVYRREQVALLEMTKQASNIKSDFLANMSHEIRTPMNAVVGMCELILRESDISETVRDYCFNIQNSGRSLLAIINDILDFSKIESGKMDFVMEEFNISSTLNDVMNMAVTRKGEKPLELIVKADPDIPVGLIGDELRIRQVIINLVTNAIKFTNEGCIVIRVSQTKHDYGINLSVSVSDTGIGISPEHLEKLFSSFQQVNTKKNREVEGTGLGLAISKRLITGMGGFVNVSSVEGEGSEFRFVLPLKVSNPQPFIAIHDAEKIHAAGYIDMKKFSMERVGSEYNELIRELSEKLGTQIELYDSVEKLKEAVEQNTYTHLFAGRQEYIAHRYFFEQESEKHQVVVVQDRNDAIDLPDNTKCIFKPFYALSVAAIFNNESMISNLNERRNRTVRFVAPKARVLIVDDNMINLKVAVGLMRPYHMQVLTADSGPAAISLLRSKDIDIVFMDHMMPVMDGIEATQEIRNMEGDYYKNLPIIALTANAVNGVREKYLSSGLNDFLAKPIELPALDRILRTWLPKNLMKAPSPENEFSGKAGDRRQSNRAKSCNEAANETKKGTDNELFRASTGVFYTGGDEEAYLDILKLYVRKASEKREQIQKLYEDKEWKDYVIEVHALKSSSLSIGSKALSEIAKELELAGKGKDYSVIEQKHDRMMEMYLKVEELGRAYVKEHQQNDEQTTDSEDVAATELSLPEISADDLAKKVEKIREAADNFDGDTIISLCEELFAYQINGKLLKNLFAEVKQEAEEFEYDSAAQKAEKVVAGIQ